MSGDKTVDLDESESEAEAASATRQRISYETAACDRSVKSGSSTLPMDERRLRVEAFELARDIGIESLTAPGGLGAFIGKMRSIVFPRATEEIRELFRAGQRQGYPQGKGKGCVIAEDEALAYPEEESHDDDNSQDGYGYDAYSYPAAETEEEEEDESSEDFELAELEAKGKKGKKPKGKAQGKARAHIAIAQRRHDDDGGLYAPSGDATEALLGLFQDRVTQALAREKRVHPTALRDWLHAAITTVMDHQPAMEDERLAQGRSGPGARCIYYRSRFLVNVPAALQKQRLVLVLGWAPELAMFLEIGLQVSVEKGDATMVENHEIDTQVYTGGGDRVNWIDTATQESKFEKRITFSSSVSLSIRIRANKVLETSGKYRNDTGSHFF
ncbi:hypothetical protein AK812_SmicGene38127 [Symbiodinium microadriaticum]|uniref:Uncharacterized protein n=1 Tax=Symbiodinium microadriaticum TaxID=2951 RepID=A0A1Q9CEI5_SYMMI|nr:hypothetical protein AK812_SmicGene38127 [Symbiodinium microadriaticum]